ncbi:MAG: hypothetical protein A2751_03485 [Candidatus Doudnabacteria bacterium RIFCSPHIGHO2_01_FULL_46_14]|uniref:HTH arsR-type domain-containing protein n=1 Tax=Candidatus Doudnabacteria bacterium RIFCSPHIGHO2_01_FULL_46_14 TaxID=1817824 RepID=A0A1F5NKW9_9BACT|nr:MAG: hypothetical protein A2751_03485 [Candidatus Doudnabacteria bacterium RIFCSPHIGHO2_01_FULL_46_14]
MKTRKNRELVLVFKTLGDINRYRIFRSLIEKKHMVVSNIAKTLSISMPLSSQHLKILTLSGLVNKKKHGRSVYYFLNLDNWSVRSIIKVFPINKKVSNK